MGLVYRPAPGVSLKEFHHHPVFTTEQGGLIYTDRAVKEIWESAADSHLRLSHFDSSTIPEQDWFTRAALACLAEAGCLERSEYEVSPRVDRAQPNGGLVSVIIICHDSLEWLKICLPSLAAQDYSPLETILVDNASSDDTAAWILKHYPTVNYCRLDNHNSLAAAINLGVGKACGDYHLLLNPDTRLASNSISILVRTALTDPHCAAVAAKLRLMRAPAFLNGLGNYVGGISWGADVALGHLDVEQFDGWKTVPSACFAAALIPAPIWKEVGELDPGFPMYYEDSEWCYRARKYGFRILAAPGAVVYHAFSGQTSLAPSGGMDPQKLQRVAYGRLRFSCLMFSLLVTLRFLATYFIEDFFHAAWFLLTGRFNKISAYVNAWREFFTDLPEIMNKHAAIRNKSKTNDRELLSPLRQVPVPLVRHGLPLLTRDVIKNELLPLILSGKTKYLPEFHMTSHDSTVFKNKIRRKNWIARLVGIWRIEGFDAMLHRIGRMVEWRLL